MPRTEIGEGGLIDRPRMRLHAPAKINLALHVTGRRSDGYHEIDSLVVFTELGDELTVEPARVDSFRIGGPFANAIPNDSDNLVLCARDLFRQQHSFTQPLSMTLTKNLPPASGIGGGSSDAAACLVAMAELARSDVSLSSTGATLGADVPMCLAAEPLIARGVGEEISLVSSFPSLAMALVNPGVEVPTPEIFRRLASPNNTLLPALEQANDIVGWLSSCRNDLQAPAIGYAPVIADVLAGLDACGARLARMSGSGATCFGIFPDMVSANLAAEQLHARRPSWFVKATRSHASGEFRRRIET